MNPISGKGRNTLTCCRGEGEKYEYDELVEIRSFLTKELISYLVGGVIGIFP